MTAPTDLDLVIDTATSAELVEYVIPSWLSSYCLGFVGQLMRADSRHGTGREIYWQSQRDRIAKLLQLPSTTVLVARVDDEPVAWVCYDESRHMMHYLLVNRAFRRQRVATSLLPAWFLAGPDICRITHLPPPFFSRRLPGETRELPMKPHMVIDLISPLT